MSLPLNINVELTEDNWILVLITIVVSSIITWIVTVLTIKKKIRSNYNNRLFGLYNRMCQDIVETILPLTDISIRSSRYISIDVEKQITNKLSDLFYKYYNYLPEGVLMSLMCLHTCLKGNGKNPYFYIKGRGCLIVTPCKTRKDILLLLKRTSIENYIKKRRDEYFLYRFKKSYKYAMEDNSNFKEKIIRFYKCFTLKMPIGQYPRRLILNIQARYVIACIDKYFGTKHLLNWSSTVKKHTIA